jgi:hypothetical protein
MTRTTDDLMDAMTSRATRAAHALRRIADGEKDARELAAAYRKLASDLTAKIAYVASLRKIGACPEAVSDAYATAGVYLDEAVSWIEAAG